MKLQIAFQGEPGAFSQIAVQLLGGPEAVAVPLATFGQVCQFVAYGKQNRAVIPIENTLHGSVHENYDLLVDSRLAIAGEAYVRIVHNLIAAPGTRFEAVRQVYSHPVALNQCLTFFEHNPQLRSEPFYDTAGSVKMIMEKRPPAAAAIASAAAARIYGARILRKSIEDNRENYTRFFLLERPRRRPAPRLDRPYKTSLVFTVPNAPGALFRSLGAFALRDLSLTRIESRPIRGRPWEYLFYVDFLGHIDDPACRNAVNHLRELAETLHILGCYPAASGSTPALSGNTLKTWSPHNRKTPGKIRPPNGKPSKKQP